MKLEIKKIGNSTGIILPKELLAQVGLKQGDTVTATLLPEGALKLTQADDTFDKGLEIARKAMKTYRATLRQLAK
jgi:putative addiction module antidote